MLVQSLVEYANTYLQQQLDEIAFEEKPVDYAINIFPSGEFAGAQPLGGEGKKRGKPLLIPRSPVIRTSGIHPMLAYDAVQYVLGPAEGVWTPPGKLETHRHYFEGFIELIQEAHEATGDEALAACIAFYSRPDEVEKARQSIIDAKPGSGVNVILAYKSSGLDSTGGPVIYRPIVKSYWRKIYEQKAAERHSGGGEGRCLITGEYGPIAVTHERIKGTAGLGGQAAGVSLMSFDKAAFRSYNWKQNLNSPVGIPAANAYVLALNDLLRFGDHHPGRNRELYFPTRRDYGAVGYLFWTKKPVDESLIEILESGDPAEIKLLFKEVKRLLDAPGTGNVDALKTIENNLFHLLAVSGNGGRLVVRDFFTENLTKVKMNLIKWFEDLRVADVFKGGKPAESPKLLSLFFQIATPAERKNNKYQGIVTTSLIRRALLGRPLGYSLLSKALGRLRVEPDKRLSTVRVGFIRLCVNDLTKQEILKMNDHLDPNQATPAYICGRLLAVYENIQFAAGGKDLNVNISDRYFSMASTYPGLAFPRIEQLAHAHLKKLRRDKKAAHYRLQHRLSELMKALSSDGFPRQLGLEDQGRFVIGYHHQRADDARAAAEAKERKLEKETDVEQD